MHQYHDICLVTVTYGDRLIYLSELLQRAFVDEGVGTAVVVSNASISPLEQLEQRWGKRLTILRLPENAGSAAGYSVGIQRALDGGTPFIWLMDDDNAPVPGALGSLHRELALLMEDVGESRAAVLGFRPDHQADIAMGVPPRLAVPPRSSFFGFHVCRIPYKVWRRTPWGRPCGSPPRTVKLPYAPYGGFLAHRAAFSCIGLPKTELVLYSDDTEYTWRLTAKGGAIHLVTDAVLEDLERSWNLKSRFGNVFEGFLLGEGDRRAYYSSRNQAWFDRNCWANFRPMYLVNRAIFMSLLRVTARRHNAMERLALLLHAIADGEAGLLGTQPQFPL